MMRAKFFRERGIFRAASDGRCAMAKFVRELDAEMTKPADTLHSDEIAGTVRQRSCGSKRNAADDSFAASKLLRKPERWQ